MSAEAVRYIQVQDIDPILKRYMLAIAKFLDNELGYASPSQKDLAAELGVSRWHIRKWQAECERRGYLKVSRGRE